MKRLFFLAILLLLPSLGFGAEASSMPQQITMSIDADLIAFIKLTIWIGGSFLVIYALIGGAFFGWDVRKARGSINDAQKEIKEQLKELQGDYVAFKSLKEKLEELGAKLQEETELVSVAVSVPVQASLQDSAKVQKEDGVLKASNTSGSRLNIELIREVIASSNYEWTTIGRIMKKTGLSHEEVLREIRAASDIIISFGSQTKDHIFKFAPTKTGRADIISRLGIGSFNTYQAFKACQNCGRTFDASGNKPLCPECAAL